MILGSPPGPDGLLRFSGNDFRYLSRVLRKAPGDSFRVLLPGGAEALAEVLSVEAGALTAILRGASELTTPGAARRAAEEVERDEHRRSVAAPLPPLVLLQALPRGAKMDDILRQATELGVSLILPFVAERSVSRPEGGPASQAKRERWLRILREARQQSGSDVPTDVHLPGTLDSVLATWADFSATRGGGIGLLLHQDPLAQGTLHGYLNGAPQAVALAVGPEGGFSDPEVSAFLNGGFRPVLLGANVLRTETAVVSALAAVQVLFLEKTSWMPRIPDSPVSSG